MCCQLCFLSCQLLTLDKKGLSRPLDYITFFMFNLYEHVIFYLYIKILTNIKQENMPFVLVVNLKMPTFVGILKFMSRTNFILM